MRLAKGMWIAMEKTFQKPSKIYNFFEKLFAIANYSHNEDFFFKEVLLLTTLLVHFNI